LAPVGDTLRATRERSGVSVAEVTSATGLSTRHIAALEENRFDSLPARVYARAYLRNYAEYLKLDPDPLLEEMDDFWPDVDTPEIGPVTGQFAFPVITGQTILIILVIIVIGILLGFVYNQLSAFVNSQNNGLSADGSPIRGASPVVGAKVSPTRLAGLPPGTVAGPPSPGEPSPTSEPTMAPTPTALTLEIRVTQTAWVNVQVDGKEVLNATLQPGARHSWTANEKIFIWSGFAGGVRVYKNGVDEGPLGDGVARVQWVAPNWRATTVTDAVSKP
jgi:cytoskeletal protein RodZ